MSESENRDKLVDQLWRESEKARLLKIDLEELESLQVRVSDIVRWEDFNTGQAKMKSPEGLKDAIAAGLDCQIGSKKKELDLILQRILQLLNPSTSDKADLQIENLKESDKPEDFIPY